MEQVTAAEEAMGRIGTTRIADHSNPATKNLGNDTPATTWGQRTGWGRGRSHSPVGHESGPFNGSGVQGQWTRWESNPQLPD
jgi:hypothetical protein